MPGKDVSGLREAAKATHQHQ